MRISGGLARGIRLQSPPGKETRPATDAMREALFSSLGSTVAGSRWLDLYAGCGSYGLEALSRGAVSCDFVESASAVNAILISNLDKVLHSIRCSGGNALGKSYCLKSETYLKKNPPIGVDFIIADPPYGIGHSAFSNLNKLWKDLIRPNHPPVLIWECPADEELESNHWVEVKRIGKKKGGSSLRIFRWCNQEST